MTKLDGPGSWSKQLHVGYDLELGNWANVHPRHLQNFREALDAAVWDLAQAHLPAGAVRVRSRGSYGYRAHEWGSESIWDDETEAVS